jgi:hypothetical protein
MDSGEPLTQEDIERYVAARELSQPESRGHVDEDGLWQMDDDCIEEWDAWYKQPLAEALRDRLPKQTPPKPPSRRPLQPAPAQRRGTSRATKRRRRHSAGSKGSSRGDPDSEPPLTRLQRARLAISDARRAALEQRLLAGIRECVGCRLDHPADEFRSGRRVCRRCETMARLERRAREVAA